MLRTFFKTVFANLSRKAAALLIALGIWFYANAQLIRPTAFDADIVINPPEGMVVVDKDKEVARVRLSGPEFLITQINSQVAQRRPTLAHNLGEDDVQSGWSTLEIKPRWLQLGLLEREFLQLKFESIQPEQVGVLVSPLAERVLPVQVRHSGSPPEGFRLESDPEPHPPTVRVSGPEVALKSAQNVPTEDVVQLWNVPTRSYTATCRLRTTIEVELGDGRTIAVPVTLSEQSVQVRIQLAEEAGEEASFADLPLVLSAGPQWFGPDWPYVAELERANTVVSVTVQAPPDVLRRLRMRPEVLRPYVDLTGLPEEPIAPGARAPYQEPVRLDLPADLPLTTYRVEPARVTILLKNRAR